MATAKRGRPVATDARTVAARALERTLADGAFAAAALDLAIARAGLDARDRALATELVYGALRALPWLEARLAAHAPRGLGGLPAGARAHLVVGAYQLFFTRVPAFAAVDAAVSGVRAAADARVAGFANAVLRKLAKEPRVAFSEAVRASVPVWLRAAVERSLGARAEAFFADMAAPPPVGLRVEGAPRAEVLARLRGERPGATFEEGKASPLAILMRGGGDPRALAAYRAGAVSVQEEGSQELALALGARPGERVLDACAGRGGKTAVLARAVGPDGAADACDLHASKLERLGAELARVGLGARAVHVVDWSRGAGDVPPGYDRVLVDAPCSGSGTLRRRPDVALRREPADLLRLSAAQLSILEHASTRLRPGGTLVYGVCSVLAEEGPDVAGRFYASHRGFTRAGERLLLPATDGTDGYWFATFVRVS